MIDSWAEKRIVFEYRILGPLELRASGRLVSLDGDRQRTLLGVLLLNADSDVSFDRLVRELWINPPATARRQVGNAAVAVRRAVGDGARLVTTGYGYRLELAGATLDAALFQQARQRAEAAVAANDTVAAIRRLRKGLDLWRGPLLAGLSGESIDAARTNLDEQWLTAMERLAELRLELGEVTSLAGELFSLVAEQPLRESLRALLMRALWHAGRSADALTVFEESRKVLATELGADPGPELCELHERILRSDTTLGRRDNPVIDVRPASGQPMPASCFLPGTVADFTGRDADLDRLTTMASTMKSVTGPLVISIEGMGGIGKTTLALQFAHTVMDEFPDGQYFLDLRGFTDDEPLVPVDEALDTLLRQSGMPAEQVPVGVQARKDLWRQRIAGRRVLVMLDNAADAAQVQPLLPASVGSLGLVTSRRQLLALDGAVALPLDLLASTDGVLLFRRIAGSRLADTPSDEVDEVVALCGRLPLAIRIAASRLQRRPNWTLDHLAAQLRDEHGRSQRLTAGHRSVTGAITVSYRHLTPSGQRLFHMLGLVPGPTFDAHTAAAVANLTVTEAEANLEELLESSLLLPDGPDRYGFHDLVRHCARGIAADERTAAELHDADHRLLDHYLYFTSVHCRKIAKIKLMFEPLVQHIPPDLPTPATEEDAMRSLTAESENIVAATRYAYLHGWHDHAWQLPCLLVHYFNRTGQRSGMIDLARIALAAAQRCGDRRGEALSYRAIGFALRGQGRDAEVQDALDRTIEISRAEADSRTLLVGLRERGAFLFHLGNMVDAATTYREARQLARTIGDQTIEVNMTLNLAVIDCNLGDYAEALTHLHEALAFHQQAGSAEGEAVALINIGWVDQLRDRDERAIATFEQAARLSRTIGFVRGEVLSLAWTTVSQRKAGQLTEAAYSAHAALELARRSDLSELECAALNGLGETWLASGRRREARETFLAAERLATTSALSMERGRAWEGLAHLAAGQGKLGHARRIWERALASYPPGLLDAANPRAHLAAIDDRAVTCMRCRRKTG